MCTVQHAVPPRLPTTLADHARVDLPGQDLLLGIIRHVYILPTKLDILVFEEALSRTLQLYPHTAGQLRSSDGHWFVELTNTAIPVDIEYKFDTTSHALLNGDWIAQEDLSPFLSHKPVRPFPVDHGDAPLIRFKLVFFENETSIGLTWHHALGDGTLEFRFVHTLSQFYQGLPLKYARPTFEKHHFPTPSASMRAEFWPHMPHLHHSQASSGPRQWLLDFRRDIQHVKWRFDEKCLTELRLALSSRGQNNGYLSKQDCLSAYVIAALNHNASRPVQTVQNVCSYRNISAPFITEDVAGNMVFRVYAVVPQDMVGIATALRHALVQSREQYYIHSMMAVTSDILLKITNVRERPTWILDDTSVDINSQVGIDWHSAHFGCPNGARFYMPDGLKHYLVCVRSNPTKGDDGVWQARQSVDISIAVRAELGPKVLETLARGFQYILDSEDTMV